MTHHDHELARQLYARPDKDPDTSPSPADTASGQIDDLIRRLMTREMTFAELHEAVKTELQGVFEAGRVLASEISEVQSNGTG